MNNQILNFQEWTVRDRWENTEFACLLLSLDPSNKNIRLISYGLHVAHISWPQGYEQAQAKLNIIESWSNKISDSPFYYIDKALFEEIPIPVKLLDLIKAKFKKCCLVNLELTRKYPQLLKESGIDLKDVEKSLAIHYQKEISEVINNEKGPEIKVESQIDPRLERSYLNLIGALLDLYWEKASPKQSLNQNTVISNIVDKFPKVSGLGKRTLEQKIPLARQSLQDELNELKKSQ